MSKRTAFLGTTALALATVVGSPFITSAHEGGHDHPGICHPVGSATGGNQHNGYSLIYPADASSHIIESEYPDGHYWKHEHDGRHDDYAVNGGCDFSTGTPTESSTPTDTPTDTPTSTPTSTPTDQPTSSPTDTPTAEPTTPTETPTTAPQLKRASFRVVAYCNTVHVEGRHHVAKIVRSHPTARKYVFRATATADAVFANGTRHSTKVAYTKRHCQSGS